MFRRRLDELLFGRIRKRLARKLRRAAERLAGEQIAETQSAPQPEKAPDLVTVRHYSSGQNRSNRDLSGQAEQSIAQVNSFAHKSEERADASEPKPLTIFLKDWRPFIEKDRPAITKESEITPEDDEMYNPPASGTAAVSQTITCEHINLIMALCKGQQISADKRRELYKALVNIRHSMMLQQVVKSINGSDERIKEYLNHAEREFSASAE